MSIILDDFYKCCMEGNLFNLKKNLFELKIHDINITSEIALEASKICVQNRKLDILQWLYDICKYDVSYAYLYACTYNIIDVCKWAYFNCKDIDLLSSGFILACKENNIDIVRWLADMHKINTYYEYNDGITMTAESIASKYGNLQVIQLLYDKHNNFNYLRNMYLFCENNHIDCIEWLLKSFYSINKNTIMVEGIIGAIVGNHYDLVKKLFGYDIIVNISDIDRMITCCLSHETESIIEYLWDKYTDQIILDKYFNYVCEYATLTIFDWFITNANINITDDHLILACSGNNIPIINKLLSYNLNINAKNGRCLLNAVINNNLELVMFLVSKGADIHIDDDNAFCTACSLESPDIAKWLYQQGNVNIYTIDNYSFFFAISRDRLETVKWLYEIGNFDIRDSDDIYFKEACKKNNINVATWLCEIVNEYYIDIKNNIIVDHYILTKLDLILYSYSKNYLDKIKHYAKINYNQNNYKCAICYVITNKNMMSVCDIDDHVYCVSCFTKANTIKCLLCMQSYRINIYNYDYNDYVSKMKYIGEM